MDPSSLGKDLIPRQGNTDRYPLLLHHDRCLGLYCAVGVLAPQGAQPAADPTEINARPPVLKALRWADYRFNIELPFPTP